MFRQSCANAVASSSRTGSVPLPTRVPSRSVSVELTPSSPAPAGEHAQLGSSIASPTLPSRIAQDASQLTHQRRLARRLPLRRTTLSTTSPPSLVHTTQSVQLPLLSAPLPQSVSLPTSSEPIVHIVQPSRSPSTSASTETRSPKPSSGPSAATIKADRFAAIKTVADIDRFFNFTDEQIHKMALKYPKKALKGDPSFDVLKSRVLKIRYNEILAKQKVDDKQEVKKTTDDGKGGWKDLMGLRGVPVISVSPNKLARHAQISTWLT